MDVVAISGKKNDYKPENVHGILYGLYENLPEL